MTLKVAVLGAGGRMGGEVVRAVTAAEEMTLAGAFDVGYSDDDLAAAEPDVVVDFTVPEAVMDNIRRCLALAIPVVVGTTGIADSDLAEIRSLLAHQPRLGVVIAPNFSIGAVLMMRFAAEAARFFESVEVVELHHPNKADAPSGTAMRTANLIAESRSDAGLPEPPDATTVGLPGARGSSVAGIAVHAVRLRGLVAHQEVLFGDAGETLTIRHDSFDRVAFMPGVLLACRRIVDTPGLTIGIDGFLGL